MNALDSERWPHRDHWLSRMVKLDRAVPERYCWTGLATMAMFGPDSSMATGARCADDCREESSRTGSCYCGKFRNGELRKDGDDQ